MSNEELPIMTATATPKPWELAIDNIDNPPPPPVLDSTAGYTSFGIIKTYTLDTKASANGKSHYVVINMSIEALGSQYTVDMRNQHSWPKRFTELVGPYFVRAGLLAADPETFIGKAVRVRKVFLNGVYYIPRSQGQTTHVWDDEQGWVEVAKGEGTHAFYHEGDEAYYTPRSGRATHRRNPQTQQWERVDKDSDEGTHAVSQAVLIERVYDSRDEMYADYVAWCNERGQEPVALDSLSEPEQSDDYGTVVTQAPKRAPSPFAPPVKKAAPAPAEPAAPAEENPFLEDAMEFVKESYEALNGGDGKIKPGVADKLYAKIKASRLCQKAGMTDPAAHPAVKAYLDDRLPF